MTCSILQSNPRVSQGHFSIAESVTWSQPSRECFQLLCTKQTEPQTSINWRWLQYRPGRASQRRKHSIRQAVIQSLLLESVQMEDSNGCGSLAKNKQINQAKNLHFGYISIVLIKIHCGLHIFKKLQNSCTVVMFSTNFGLFFKYILLLLLLCYYAIAVYFGHYMTGVEISDHLLWLAVYRSVNILSQLLRAEWKILSEISYLQLLYITSKQQIYVSPRENPIIW